MLGAGGMHAGRRSSSRVQLALLGGFAISIGEGRKGELKVSAAQHRAVLAYLAMQPGQSETRERLAALFWGDSPETQARQSLRQCLLRMRRDFTPTTVDPLVIDQHSVKLDPELLACDARGFATLAESDGLADIDDAIDLYRGDFLEGFALGKEAFDTWCEAQRTRLRRAARALMLRAVQSHLEAGHGPRAIAVADQAVALDPLDEETRRLQFRVLDRFQGRQAALNAAEEFVRVLKRELDCAPEPETADLIEEIRAGMAPRRVLAVPEHMPSIAVLPFTNLSDNPSREYFAEGMTQDVTNALSRLRWLLVIAWGSASVFKGQQGDYRSIASQLGARYILDGTVRTVGQRIRITSQLIHAESGKQIWAEKYDRQLLDIFDVQDEITQNVVAAIEPHLYAEESFRASHRAPDSVDVWGLVVRAIGLITRMGRRQNEEAQQLLRRALELDPNYARAHAVLSWAVWWSSQCYWIERADGHRLATLHAEDALLLDPSEPWARMAFGFTLSSTGQHERAMTELQACLNLNPNFALGRMINGWVLLRAGRFEQAIGETAAALRMSPADSFAGLYTATHGLALLGARRFDEALPFLRASVAAFAEYSGHYNTLISCCGHLDLTGEAAGFISRRNRIGPPIRISVLRHNLRHYAHCEIFVEGLRKAGVPE